jgi:SAM-dependent methyltransferase
MATADSGKLDAFLRSVVGDLGAAISVPLVILGDRLGLYKAMAGGGAMTAAQLAAKTGTLERCIREWLLNQAAGGYVEYDKARQTFRLPDEQAMVLADSQSPAHMQGGYEIILSLFRDLPKLEQAFRSDGGLDWGEHDHCLFSGTARFFRANYAGNLVNNWIPALDGVKEKLERGAVAADIGCGFGHSTMMMAEAYPNSKFIGYDNHGPSIESAREQAAGLHNVHFEVASSTSFPKQDFDFVACFDCLHDMADPVGAARHVCESLKHDGTWMIVEPFADDAADKNLNPVGRVFYGASSQICVPASLAGHGPALGAQAGETRLRDVVIRGGFGHFRRAAETPFNLVLEARP